MDKGIGFRRNIRLSWLEAAAALCAETGDAQRIRERLDAIVEIESPEARRMAIGILLNIWCKSADQYPRLRATALSLYHDTSSPSDRLWLHYGMTLLAYPFFRTGALTIGQICRYSETVAVQELKKRVSAEKGQLGGLDKAVERIVFSLRDWGILQETPQRSVYLPVTRRIEASAPALEVWMLEAALAAHPAEEIPFADLIRLPELFPFRFTITVDDLRPSPHFDVQRQGMGWDMVRIASHTARSAPLAQLSLGM